MIQGEHYVVIHKYRDKYKAVLLKGYNPNRVAVPVGASGYDEKLDNNLSRARQKVFEYAYCNEWDYYFTGTLDPKKYDRTDLPKFHKDLTLWFRHYKRKTGEKIRFLLVPEPHKDGCWHMHGLLSGVPSSCLSPFPKGTPLYGTEYLNWKDYAKKFGFTSLSSVRDAEAVAKYVTKYITKSIAALNKELGAHLYYCSRDLQKSEVTDKGMILTWNPEISPDYENEYCMVRWYDSYADALRVFQLDERPPLEMYDWEELEV